MEAALAFWQEGEAGDGAEDQCPVAVVLLARRRRRRQSD